MAARLIAEAKTDSGGCLLNGRNPSQRYVTVKLSGKILLGHRVVWEAIHGLIPAGMTVHHTCEKQRCLNVAHMELKTRSAHSKHHAPVLERCRKHDRAYDRRNARGNGVCRLCASEAEARYRKKKRAPKV